MFNTNDGPVRRKRSGKICILLVLVFLAFSASCASKAPSQKMDISRQGSRVLVLPFKNMAKIHGEAVSVKSPLGDEFYYTGIVETNAEYFLSDKLTEIVQKQSDCEVISRNALSESSTQLLANPQENTGELQRIVNIGCNEGVNAVFAGYVYRFRERVGNTMSVSEPASVTFELFLIDVDGAPHHLVRAFCRNSKIPE